MNIWFSSDFHWGHTNIVGPKVSTWDKGYRNFDSVHEMNCAITDSINTNVKHDDILYFLGDWSFGGIQNIIKFRKLIQCNTINFIFGNHDHHIRSNKLIDFGEYPIYPQSLFDSCSDYHEFRYKKTLFVLGHYSFRVWNESHRGSFNLFGHSHNTLPDYGRSLDVGWCKWRRPLHIDEIYNMLINVPIKLVDHHNHNTNA